MDFEIAVIAGILVAIAVQLYRIANCAGGKEMTPLPKVTPKDLARWYAREYERPTQPPSRPRLSERMGIDEAFK